MFMVKMYQSNNQNFCLHSRVWCNRVRLNINLNDRKRGVKEIFTYLKDYLPHVAHAFVYLKSIHVWVNLFGKSKIKHC